MSEEDATEVRHAETEFLVYEDSTVLHFDQECQHVDLWDTRRPNNQLRTITLGTVRRLRDEFSVCQGCLARCRRNAPESTLLEAAEGVC